MKKSASTGWRFQGSFHLVVARAGKICTIGIIPDGAGRWLAMAVETRKLSRRGQLTAHRAETSLIGHGHDVIGAFTTPGAAFQRADAYAEAWQAGDKAAMRCACESISKPSSKSKKKPRRLPKVGDAVLAIGPQRVRGRIVEDRGNIGMGGRRIYGVSIATSRGQAPMVIDAPLDDLKIRRRAA